MFEMHRLRPLEKSNDLQIGTSSLKHESESFSNQMGLLNQTRQKCKYHFPETSTFWSWWLIYIRDRLQWYILSCHCLLISIEVIPQHMDAYSAFLDSHLKHVIYVRHSHSCWSLQVLWWTISVLTFASIWTWESFRRPNRILLCSNLVQEKTSCFLDCIWTTKSLVLAQNHCWTKRSSGRKISRWLIWDV